MTALIGRLLGCGFEADTVTTPLQGLKSPTDAPILALRVVVTSAGLLISPPVGEHEPDGRVPTLPHFILQGGRQPMMIGGHFGAPKLDRGAPRLRRGAPNVGGLGAISGPPSSIEERPGFAGALRTLGVYR